MSMYWASFAQIWWDLGSFSYWIYRAMLDL